MFNQTRGTVVEKTNCIGIEKVEKLPDHLSVRGSLAKDSKWQWLRDLLLGEMKDEATANKQSIRKLTFPNPKEMRRAQTSVANCAFSERQKGKRQQFPSSRFIIRTRSEVDNSTGYGILYVVFTYNPLGI